MKTTETVTLPLFFLFLFIWCGGAFFNNVLCRNAMSVFMPFSSIFNVLFVQ